MTLNQFAAEKRMAIFEDLRANHSPREGAYDIAVLAEARTKGAPQMGSTRYTPGEILFEFIYPDPLTTATILTIALPSPERIVFMPVPSWVIENIWQGDIAGTHHFESEANRLMQDLQDELTPPHNRKWFLPQAAKRRE